MLYKCLAFFVLGATVVSCNKNDHNPIGLKQERESFIMGKQWHQVHTSDDFLNDSGSTTHVEEDYPFSQNFINDDFIVYNSDHTYRWDDNVLLNPNDTVHVIIGTWYMSDDGNTLERKHEVASNAAGISPVIYETVYQISAMTASSFTLMQDVGFAKQSATFEPNR